MMAYNLTSTFSKILGIQTAFKSTFFSPTHFRPMSSISQTDPEINRTLTYWFSGPSPQKKWYGGGPQIDTEIRTQFSSLITKARSSQLESWTTDPRGSLALIILLDQFTRNIYRDTPESFASDPLAFEIATRAIAKEFHHEVPFLQQVFFFMPLMHSENLIGQVAGCGMFDSLVARCGEDEEAKEFVKTSRDFTYRHKEAILRFGRFPSRNRVLGRKSTVEEEEFLRENPGGF